MPDAFSRGAVLLRKWFGNLARVLLPGRGFYIWGGYANLGNYPSALKESGLYYSQGIVWDKELSSDTYLYELARQLVLRVRICG